MYVFPEAYLKHWLRPLVNLISLCFVAVYVMKMNGTILSKDQMLYFVFFKKRLYFLKITLRRFYGIAVAQDVQ